MEFQPGFARSDGPRFYGPQVLHLRPSIEAAPSHDFGVGLEKEFFLVDAETMSIAPHTPDSLFKTGYVDLRDRIGREMLQAQVEVSTAPCSRMADARLQLFRLRQTVAASAAEHGLVILAAGTHPTARWRTAVHTPKERYNQLMDGLQMLGQRNMLCGSCSCRNPRPAPTGGNHVTIDSVRAIAVGVVDVVAVLAIASDWSLGLSPGGL